MPMQEDAISPGVDLNYVVSTKCARGTQWEPFSVKLKDISNKFCKIFFLGYHIFQIINSPFNGVLTNKNNFSFSK